MYKLLANYALFTAIVFLLFSCSSDDSTPTPEEISGYNSIVNVEDAGENCDVGGIKITVGQDTNENDVLDESEIQSTSFVCDGITSNAPLLATATPEFPGSNCEFGGTLIRVGTDINGNNELDDDEVQTTFYVCNGTDGSDGTNGTNGSSSLTRVSAEEPGSNCTTGGLLVEVGLDLNSNTTLDDGEITSSYFICNGLDGSDGINGANGISTLITITNEDPGANCSEGGLMIEVGQDDNGNNTLDAGEVDATNFVCDGQNGGVNGFSTLSRVTPEPPGANCTNGGSKIDIGLDDDRSGTLENREIDYTYYSCDGANGADGNDGSDGAPGSDGTNGADGFSTLIRTTTEPAGSNCTDGGIRIDVGLDANRNGTFDAGEEFGLPIYVCNGQDGVNGSDGNDGADGQSIIVVTSAAGAACTNGGTILTFGYSTNGDADLNDAGDVILTSYTVCNGVDGSNGADGADGSDGADGTNGADGASTIIVTSTEPAGVNCSNGGTRIEVALDLNGNLTIDVGELISTSYVCNGADGVDGADGSNGSDGQSIIVESSAASSCGTRGGTTFRFGYDNTGDGDLGDPADVILETVTICNGSNGIDGQDGTSDNIFEFYFTEGINGYSGVFDASINQKDGTERGQSFSVDRQTNDSHGLLYFSKIDEFVKNDLGDKFEIVESILFLRGTSTRIDGVSQDNWVGVKIIQPSAPLFVEEEVNWNMANSGETWSLPGVTTSNGEPGDALGFSDMYRLPYNFIFDGYIPLQLNRSEIKAWVQDPTQNKGVVLLMADNNVPYALDVFSSNYDKDANFRPTLYIKAQLTTGGRVEKLSNAEYKAQWEAKTYQEKLTPLYNRN